MKKLVVCNTVYQIFVALWLKRTLLKRERVDIIISDHMVGGEDISKRIANVNEFENVYFAKTKKLVKSEGASFKQKILYVVHPNKIIKDYVSLSSKYDEIYIANIDRFSVRLYHAIANDLLFRKRNKHAKVVIYEDGLSTYSQLFNKWYTACVFKKRKWLPFYKPKSIYGNVNRLLVFDKECVLWTPNMPVVEIPKIDVSDNSFKSIVNSVFAFDETVDKYDKKYIFMEESFFEDGKCIDDISVVEEIVKKVGKENIIVKIHPRNSVNRFEQLGYKTNKNVSIPWEVIVLNQNMNDKVLLTISSTSVLNPKRLFGVESEAYFFYDRFDNADILDKDLLNVVEKILEKYYNRKNYN